METYAGQDDRLQLATLEFGSSGTSNPDILVIDEPTVWDGIYMLNEYQRIIVLDRFEIKESSIRFQNNQGIVVRGEGSLLIENSVLSVPGVSSGLTGNVCGASWSGIFLFNCK